MAQPNNNTDIDNAMVEKASAGHEERMVGTMCSEDREFLNNFPADKAKRAVRKVDYRLVPMLVLLYLFAYLDKTNLGNAKIEGLPKDLNMKQVDYNVAVSIFFIPFILAEVPSNILLHMFKRPSLYMGGIVTAWGIVMTFTGIVQSYGGLLAIRFLLGLFEAGFLPGAILIISEWYLPTETQTRIAILYTSAATGGAFSGLLAFAIAKMDGVAGLEGWRWIFLLEGIATVVIGVSCFFLLLDTPALAKFLNEDEKRYLVLRQQARRPYHVEGEGDKHFDRKAFFSVLTDWKIYLLIFCNWSNAVPNYALKFSMPQIIKNMGYTSSKAQLMTIPPYSCGAISAYAFAIFADKYSWRWPFLIGPQCAVIVAYSILFAMSAKIEENIGPCYFAVCLACAGMYPILPGVNAWNVANCPNPQKRAVSIGFLVCIGNVGGLIGSYIYLDREAPKYPTGYGTSLAFVATGLCAGTALEFILRKLNAKKALMDENEVRAKYSDQELDAMGEKSPLFKYNL